MTQTILRISRDVRVINLSIAAELVILSIKVTKSNSFWGSTDVCLIITKENIYHFEKKSKKI